MKLLKRFATAILSVSIMTGISSVGEPLRLNAEAASGAVSYRQALNNWDSKFTSEMRDLSKDYYWNNKDGGTYSHTACDHSRDGTNNCNSVYYHAAYEYKGQIYQEAKEKSEPSNQCFGFAYKLAQHFWGTDYFIRRKTTYTDPKVGDIVRLHFTAKEADGITTRNIGHSLFITGISGSDITFADCNADLNDCRIRWKATEYYDSFEVVTGRSKGKNMVKVTKDYLKSHTEYYYRPILKGDFDSNDRIDSSDVEHFKTYLKYGQTGSNPTEMFDINSDGKLTEADYTQLQYYANLSYVDGHLFGTGRADEYYTDRYALDGGFVCENGIYKSNGDGTASFVKPFLKETQAFIVRASVKDSSGRSYTVTDIGGDYKGPVKNMGGKLKSIVVPSTVKRIKPYAFCNTPLQRFIFNGNNSNLKTIDGNAFYNCADLESLDLRYCPYLSSIGDSAFSGCNSLQSINLPYGISSISLGKYSGIFASGKSNKTTIYVNNLSSSSYQLLRFYGNNDIPLWKSGKISLCGKNFKVYDNNTLIAVKTSSYGTLSAPK